MSKPKYKKPQIPNNNVRPKPVNPVASVSPGFILSLMKSGREYESLVANSAIAARQFDFASEVRLAIDAIEAIRGRPLLIYAANVVNRTLVGDTGISRADDLPFNEMISDTNGNTEADFLVVTPGGEGQQVAQFVNHARKRFAFVAFLIPYMAMSAGTIWALSGDEIWMTPQAILGPIDPQVPGRNGQFIPAQALLATIKDIQARGDEALRSGRSPDWTDQLLLRNIDAKEIGDVLSQSAYSIGLAKQYLMQYKFNSWLTHSSDGRLVTDDDKESTAERIAMELCSHDTWKMHSHGISREALTSTLKLRINHTETVPDLHQAISRLWALMYWAFENTAVLKIMMSKNYSIIRSAKVGPQ